eukprot:Gb_32176 [translate_table: standard]
MAASFCFSLATARVHMNGMPPPMEPIGPWGKAMPPRVSVASPWSMDISHTCSWNSSPTPALRRRKVLTLSTSVTHEATPLVSEEAVLEVSDQVSEVESNPEQEEEIEQGEAGSEEVESYPLGVKVYVGNLPYSCDSAELAGILEECGSVEMVEVIYDRNTGTSRGFAFATMTSVEDANAAIEKLDGSEYGGRTLRVNFPDKPRTTGFDSNSNFVDSQHKVFVGNLAWGVNAETLTEVFREHGNLLGAKVLYDRETGRSRGFGFVSFSSESEVEAAVASLNGMELEGRAMRVHVALGRRTDE